MLYLREQEFLERLAMKFLGGSEPWQDITKNLDRRKGAVVAAVSYLGPDAPRIMNLKSGDLLVCDASDRSIRAGSTSPHALIAYIKKGVDVYTRENLHSKVIVAGSTAWIGSANASSRSEKVKFEATVRTNDLSVVSGALDFIVEQIEESIPVTLGMAKSWIKLMPKKVAIDPLELPSHRPLKVLIIDSWEDWKPEEEERYESNLSAAKSVRSSLGSRSKLFYFESSQDLGYRVQDWVMWVDGEKIQTPLIVVGVFKQNKKYCHYFAKSTAGDFWVDKNDFEKKVRFKVPEDESEVIPEKIAQKIFNYFQIE